MYFPFGGKGSTQYIIAKELIKTVTISGVVKGISK
jgi:hypothetical protein